MPLYNADNQPINDYSIDELIERAAHMRGLNLGSLLAAGSGHSGGTLSVMDIAAALYLKVAHLKPSDPNWDGRDRIIWSAGHKAPALYVALAVSGHFDTRELLKLRLLGSPYQGHPHWRDLPGVEISTGSLGQGLSAGIGMALAARLDKKEFRVFVISSDGEQQEGSVWEAAMAASHHKLGRLIQIIDRNRLQIDGFTSDIMNIEPLGDKYRAFGWDVIEIDGHDMTALVDKLEWARNKESSGRPVVIICDTIKGKGVSFMEDQPTWHGKPPNVEEYGQAIIELHASDALSAVRITQTRSALQARNEDALQSLMPPFSRDFFWNRSDDMTVTMEATRFGFGRALKACGSDERIVCIGADISDSICISDFYKEHPERKSRFISVGIAEQNGTTIAAGLARSGKKPVFGTYGVFASARNLDQIRLSVCYANLDVLIVGAHGGLSVGPDGATHQELESFFAMTGLPNMKVVVPCDAVETEKATTALLMNVEGPKYLRFARAATAVLTDKSSPFEFAVGNIFRVRDVSVPFARSYEICLAREYASEGEDLTIISCGPETAEAVRAAYILKAEHKIESRVLHLHTIKPLDTEAVIRAATETGCIITAEEHQIGGLGNRIAASILTERTLDNREIKLHMIGVPDRFGESGEAWQLLRKFGLTAEFIAQKGIELINPE